MRKLQLLITIIILMPLAMPSQAWSIFKKKSQAVNAQTTNVADQNKNKGPKKSPKNTGKLNSPPKKHAPAPRRNKTKTRKVVAQPIAKPQNTATKALGWHNGNHMHRSALGRLVKEKLPYSNEEQATLLYNQALQQLQQGEHAVALMNLQQILTVMPTHTGARTRLIEYYLARKDNKAAEELLVQGLHVDPKQPLYIKQQALMLHDQAQHKQALSLLLTMPKVAQSDPEYQTLLALSYLNGGMFDLAEKKYTTLLDTDPGNSKLRLGLALAQEKRGNTKAAIASFQKARSNGGLDSETLQYIQQRLQQLQRS